MTEHEINTFEFQIAGLHEASKLRNAVSAFGNGLEKMDLPEDLAIDSVEIVNQLSAIERELKNRIRETRKKWSNQNG